MKILMLGRWGAAVGCAVIMMATAARGQGIGPDTGWDARMAALQEEENAQAGVAVSIVFDDSGSMNDNHKLSMAKKAFRAWIEHAPDNYRFGLVALNAGVLVPLQRNDRAQILAAVNKLRAAGDTPLADTIAQAAAEIRQRRAAGALYERQVVVILTDGEDNTRRGPKGVQQEIRALRAGGVEVIAFGYQGEGDYMNGSATHFYSPEDEQGISQGLNAIGAEIGDTADVVLDDATRAEMRKVAEAGGMAKAPEALPAVTPVPDTATAARQPFSPYASTPGPVATTKTRVVQAQGQRSHAWLWVLLLGCALLFRRRRRR